MAEVTLAGLRVVREVALSGSFSAAARALGYSQPAISRQVAALESAAGAPLFSRGTRGVVLSPAGEIVAEHAARLLAGVEALGHELAALHDRMAGEVVLGTYPTAAAVLAPRAIARLGRLHPGLRVTLREASSPALVRAVRAGRVDVAVVAAGTGLPEHDLHGLSSDHLPTGELLVAVAAGHRLAGAARVPVAELAAEPWVVGRGQGSDPQFEAWPTLDSPVVAHRVRSWPARLGLVAAGLGMCVIPETAAASVPAGLVLLRVDDPGWRGRRALVVTRAAQGGGIGATVDALHAEAAGR